jgi:hypothetical protein
MFSQTLSKLGSRRFAMLLTVLLYIAGIGLLALLRSFDLVRGLTTPEVFYGPAQFVG